MPSGAKRRAAKKKKKDKKTATAVTPSDNGEVKATSQDLETHQNPFTKDENKEPSLSTESMKNGELLNGDGYAVENVVEDKSEHADDAHDSVKGGVNHGCLSKSTNGSLSKESLHYDDGTQVVAVEAQKEEKEDSKEVTDPESFADGDASHVKVSLESNLVALDKVVIHEPESLPVQKSVGSAVAKLEPKKHEDKVHPSETFSASKTDNLPFLDTNSGESSRESYIKLMPGSNILIGNHQWHAESSDIHQCHEKETLLPPAAGPSNKTSFIGCCGFLELFYRVK